MPIVPLPQFEADLEADRKIYESLKPPTSIVVRFGIMKLVGEFPYSGDAKPGCGSKMVVRTHRGTELGEMLTSTCPNSGCSKSVSRKEMLEYIENSGGKDYPFFNQGRVLRVATVEDLNQQAKIDAERPKMLMEARRVVGELNLPMKVIDAEPILGAERLTFYFTSEDRIDFRDLVAQLAPIYHTRIEMRQVGARDEARLVADYERCGQHCCCKQFLKVLKPVSMKSAKIQKATLDPLKISGRCGRLMCCLRYEDQTYDELRKRLPRKKSRVFTPSGWGFVVDSQILTQLVLVHLEDSNTEIAVAVEDLQTGPGAGTAPQRAGGADDATEDDDTMDAATGEAGPRPAADRPATERAPASGRGGPGPNSGARPPRPDRTPPGASGERGRPEQRQDRPRGPRPDQPARSGPPQGGSPSSGASREPARDGDRRDQRPPRPPGPSGGPRPPGTSGAPPQQGPAREGPASEDDGGPESGPGGDGPRKRRRRRRRGGGGGGGGAPGGGSASGGPQPA